MKHDQACRLEPEGQRQYLQSLLAKLPPDVRAATAEVVQWLASEFSGQEPVTPEQVVSWIADVRARNAARPASTAGAKILSFRRAS